MAATLTPPRAPFGSETLQRLAAAVDRRIGELKRSWAVSETRDQLLRLTPRQRADIGLGDAALPTLDLDEIARSLAAGRR